MIGLCKPQTGKGLTRDKSNHENVSVLEVCSDSDWSGCKKTRKSVSSCAILWDNVLLYSHSKTQKTISLSSAEAEYNSLLLRQMVFSLLHASDSSCQNACLSKFVL